MPRCPHRLDTFTSPSLSCPKLGAYEAMDGYVDDVLACVVKVSEDDPRYPELRKGLLPLLRSGCKVEGRAATLRRVSGWAGAAS